MSLPPWTTPDADFLLSMPDISFADLLVSMFRRATPAENVMVIVAYANIDVMLDATKTAFEAEGQTWSDNFIDEVIRRYFAKINSTKNDELSNRRRWWLSVALMFRRLMNKEASNHDLRARVIEIWMILANSGSYLKDLLEDNVLWSATDKAWFDDLRNGNDVVWYVANLMVPEVYRDDPELTVLGQRSSP
jgi:hypothetical protein